MERFIDFAHSVQGANHIKSNKECQDSSDSYSDDLMSIIAVADGHGSDNYPRTKKGSLFAVAAALDVIKEFVETAKKSGIDIIDIYEEQQNRFLNLALNILKQWHNKVDEDLRVYPFLADELEKVSDSYKKQYAAGERCKKAYGTTLIAVCATADCWFGLHIGDGKCVAIDRAGGCFEPIPWDENCQANITTSICDSDAIDEFRFICKKEFPLGIFMGSDGIDDSYAGDGELHDLYRTVLCLFAEHDKTRSLNEIKDFLPNISRNGSGDDVSMAGLVQSPIPKETIARIKARKEYETASRELQLLKKEAAIAEEKYIYIQNEMEKAKQASPVSETDAERLRDMIQKAEQRLAQADSLRDQTEARKAQAKRQVKKAKHQLDSLRFFREEPVTPKKDDLGKKKRRKKPKKQAQKRDWKKLSKRKKH